MTAEPRFAPRRRKVGGAVALLAMIAIAPAPGAGQVGKARPKTTALITGDKALLGRKVVAIEHVGLDRTKPFVVRRELLFAAGETLRESVLRETVQRLRNLRIFRMVSAELKARDGGVVVVLAYDEKWTLLPVFTLGRGGARTYLAAGASDINTLGRLMELGAHYTYFAGTHSYSARFEQPRLFDERLHLSVYGELGNRNRYLYDRDGELEQVYSRHRRWGSVRLTDLRRPKRVWSAVIDVISDDFDTALLDGEEREANVASGAVPPPDHRHVLVGASYRHGRVDLDDYIESGGYLYGAVSASLPRLGTTDGYVAGKLIAKLALPLPLRQNVVLRAVVGAKSARRDEFMYYVGGLRYVRGFFEGRFAGRMMWAANAEYRVPSVHHRWVVLQHVLFCDMGDAGDTIGHFGRRPGISVGTGGRLLLPLVAGFVARMDIAWFIEPERRFSPARDWRLSFGSQQYF